ncbi:MAG: metallophosphoesterase [Draconibacterium sp.]|nr:metallophosphoesterase [Draconibacterium sp.]
MNRRNFLNSALLTGLASTFSPVISVVRLKTGKTIRGTFSVDKNKVSIYTKASVSPTRIFHITDTHLSIDDERGVQYQQFSKRMADAYKSNIHFQTGNKISTKESFEQTLQIAKKQGIDFLALTGDIFSFPSEAAVEWVLQKLNNTKIPFAYVAGNHDWHYEGMPGSSQQLRETWSAKHLKPMYQGNNPLFASYNINGIRFVCIDNSTYEILPEQLDFFKMQVKSKLPFILLMHIPLYMPGRTLGYGCANPNWGANTDKNFEVERREKWRSDGHTKVTMNFYYEVFNAPNLLTILAGHTHRPAIDVKNGIPQIVSGHNATGYFTDINVQTMD